MENLEPLVAVLLKALKENERALLELSSVINNLDDRLEHFRLEALSVSKATWLHMAKDAQEGHALTVKLQRSAGQFKQAALLLLKERLPEKAARLDAMPPVLEPLFTS